MPRSFVNIGMPGAAASGIRLLPRFRYPTRSQDLGSAQAGMIMAETDYREQPDW